VCTGAFLCARVWAGIGERQSHLNAPSVCSRADPARAAQIRDGLPAKKVRRHIGLRLDTAAERGEGGGVAGVKEAGHYLPHWTFGLQRLLPGSVPDIPHSRNRDFPLCTFPRVEKPETRRPRLVRQIHRRARTLAPQEGGPGDWISISLRTGTKARREVPVRVSVPGRAAECLGKGTLRAKRTVPALV
jgi:hypothetical protein